MKPLMPSVSAPQADGPAQSGFLFGDDHPLIRQKHTPDLERKRSPSDSQPALNGHARTSDVHPSTKLNGESSEIAEYTTATDGEDKPAPIQSDQLETVLDPELTARSLPEAIEIESLHNLERETTVQPDAIDGHGISSESVEEDGDCEEHLPDKVARVGDALQSEESLVDGRSLVAITKHLSEHSNLLACSSLTFADTTLQPKTVSSLPADYVTEKPYRPFVVHKPHEPSAYRPLC